MRGVGRKEGEFKGDSLGSKKKYLIFRRM